MLVLGLTPSLCRKWAGSEVDGTGGGEEPMALGFGSGILQYSRPGARPPG
jgi:hypothetical protein